MSPPKLLFLVTEDWYFWSHRLNLARAARDTGFEVHVATRVQDHGKRIESEGFKLIPIRLLRSGRRPIRELSAIIELIQLYRRLRPDIVHHVAMKPILYGSWAARLTRVPAVVNAFAGLGFTFIAEGHRVRMLRSAIQLVLRMALALPHSRVIFQNSEDCDLMVGSGIVRETQKVVIRGSGVDVAKFVPRPEPEGEAVIVLATRMLWDKGVGEFVEAVRLLRKQKIRAKFFLVGMVDQENPAAIPESQLLAWQSGGMIEWRGHQDEMPEVLASAHVVVLPSYREGLPKILLEAAACARPIVATDVPGCREIVRDGENGVLVPPKDPNALARAIATLIGDPAMRRRMGTRGREIVEKEFSMEEISRQTLAVYRELLGDRRADTCRPRPE